MLNNTNFVDAEGTLTLGVLTFNQFGPKDLKVGVCTAAIKMNSYSSLAGHSSIDQEAVTALSNARLQVELLGVQLLQGVESPDQYSTEATFKVHTDCRSGF